MAMQPLTDAKRIESLQLFDVMFSPAYDSNPNIMLITQLKSARWAMKFGISEFSLPSLALYGMILLSAGDVDKGTMLGTI